MDEVISQFNANIVIKSHFDYKFRLADKKSSSIQCCEISRAVHDVIENKASSVTK